MKNAYLTSHFPLISIVIFSLSFSIYSTQVIISWFEQIGLYDGMVEFFSERGIHLALLFLLWLFFFMLFSALKLIADTVNELSLLFFSKDSEGTDLTNVRGGAWFFLIGSIISLLTIFDIRLLVILFLCICFFYFIYFVYKVSYSLSSIGVIGMILFHIFFWISFILLVLYAMLKIYNSIIASLPI
ncbi:YufK family protein [Evansella cellulosilytica]|uniref:YufK family protein n=1 Tax=Evansella cellulosilytica (strain ATCC 21833 / DSM 2522 / FERM P-1141 / JCM 9156 / N-4) TaxID=649639 RepID=E6TTJ0_EVAC2|nr:YufK family protein [Evansella cellulosilytica]ADU29626.1 hypothetical protein Bcell_1361 [Evansella cellulosilytica DSM 2522]